LTLLNDPVFIELAANLADRVLFETTPAQARSASEGSRVGTDNDRLTHAFRTVLTRRPNATELAQMRAVFEQAQSRYLADDKATQQLLGKREPPAGVDSAEWAAWFNLAHVLLNLDEAITKN
jgi:hypothetical protein